jgi:hypothetical protein
LGKVLDKVWDKNEAASVASWGNTVRGVLQHIGIGMMQNDTSVARNNIEDLKRDFESEELPSWSWDEYSRFYPEYCELSHRFRCGDYDALSLISAIKFDWHPIGISNLRSE